MLCSVRDVLTGFLYKMIVDTFPDTPLMLDEHRARLYFTNMFLTPLHAVDEGDAPFALFTLPGSPYFPSIDLKFVQGRTNTYEFSVNSFQIVVPIGVRPSMDISCGSSCPVTDSSDEADLHNLDVTIVPSLNGDAEHISSSLNQYSNATSLQSEEQGQITPTRSRCSSLSSIGDPAGNLTSCEKEAALLEHNLPLCGDHPSTPVHLQASVMQSQSHAYAAQPDMSVMSASRSAPYSFLPGALFPMPPLAAIPTIEAIGAPYVDINSSKVVCESTYGNTETAISHVNARIISIPDISVVSKRRGGCLLRYALLRANNYHVDKHLSQAELENVMVSKFSSEYEDAISGPSHSTAVLNLNRRISRYMTLHMPRDFDRQEFFLRELERMFNSWVKNNKLLPSQEDFVEAFNSYVTSFRTNRALYFQPTQMAAMFMYPPPNAMGYRRIGMPGNLVSHPAAQYQQHQHQHHQHHQQHQHQHQQQMRGMIGGRYASSVTNVRNSSPDPAGMTASRSLSASMRISDNDFRPSNPPAEMCSHSLRNDRRRSSQHVRSRSYSNSNIQAGLADDASYNGASNDINDTSAGHKYLNRDNYDYNKECSDHQKDVPKKGQRPPQEYPAISSDSSINSPFIFDVANTGSRRNSEPVNSAYPAYMGPVHQFGGYGVQNNPSAPVMMMNQYVPPPYTYSHPIFVQGGFPIPNGSTYPTQFVQQTQARRRKGRSPTVRARSQSPETRHFNFERGHSVHGISVHHYPSSFSSQSNTSQKSKKNRKQSQHNIYRQGGSASNANEMIRSKRGINHDIRKGSLPSQSLRYDVEVSNRIDQESQVRQKKGKQPSAHGNKDQSVHNGKNEPTNYAGMPSRDSLPARNVPFGATPSIDNSQSHTTVNTSSTGKSTKSPNALRNDPSIASSNSAASPSSPSSLSSTASSKCPSPARKLAENNNSSSNKMGSNGSSNHVLLNKQNQRSAQYQQQIAGTGIVESNGMTFLNGVSPYGLTQMSRPIVLGGSPLLPTPFVISQSIGNSSHHTKCDIPGNGTDPVYIPMYPLNCDSQLYSQTSNSHGLDVDKSRTNSMSNDDVDDDICFETANPKFSPRRLAVPVPDPALHDVTNLF